MHVAAELASISLAAALVVSALVLATPASPATGRGSTPLANGLATRYDSEGLIDAGSLEPAARREIARIDSPPPPRAGAAGRHRRPPVQLKYYIGVDFQTVAPGGAQLFEIRCPHERERSLTGGTFAPAGGLVVVNSSSTNPSPDLPTSERAWYEAVLNLTSAPQQWKAFVTCARG
jgi:hypothetical protein